MKILIHSLIILVITFMVSCANLPAIQYPVPELPNRPNLLFFTKEGAVCLERPEMQDMFKYVVELELELLKAKQTIQEINKIDE